jgi:hypothetical protein
MLTALSLAGRGDNVVNAGVEEVDAAVAVAATEGGQGDKLDDWQLHVPGRRLPRAPCTAENAERCPPASMMQQQVGRAGSRKNVMARKFMVATC